MKNAILAAAALGMSGISAFAQGTLNFANAGVGLQAKVTDTDQVTGLAGTAWEADLFWAPGVVTDPWLLTALGQPATFSTVPSQAGFFFGGPRTIPTAPGVITAQVRIWDAGSGPSWAVAITNPGAQLGESVLLFTFRP